MTPSYYFDDPDDGLSRETSHPRFVELAPEDFYYDGCDDFSPFGNDDGHDTLSDLQDWYRASPKNTKTKRFLKKLLTGWGLNVPENMIREDSATVERWLSQARMHETYLQAECRAREATAFGQLKITGQVDADILEEGLTAIRRQLWLNKRARTVYPDWPHADKQYERLVKMQDVLVKLCAE
jgi:uncharacterized protein YfeS